MTIQDINDIVARVLEMPEQNDIEVLEGNDFDADNRFNNQGNTVDSSIETSEPSRNERLSEAISSIHENVDVEQKSSLPSGYTEFEKAAHSISQIQAGFIPFEARDGYRGNNAIKGKELESLRMDKTEAGREKYPEFGQLLGIDTTQYHTKGGDKNIFIIPISYQDFKDVLTHNTQNSKIFKEDNINKITAVKQRGEQVEISGFRQNPIKLSPLNIVTLDVEFKDGSHLDKTMIVDDMGQIRGLFDFEVQQFDIDGGERYAELPIREEYEEKDGVRSAVLLKIDALDRTNPDHEKASVTKGMNENKVESFRDTASKVFDEAIEKKIEAMSDKISAQEKIIDGRIAKLEQDVDVSRGFLSKAEIVKTNIGAKVLSIENGVKEKLSAYNTAVFELNETEADKDSAEYKAISDNVDKTKTEFYKAYADGYRNVKGLGLDKVAKAYDIATKQYENDANALDKEHAKKDNLYGYKEDIGGKLVDTSWSKKVETGITVDNSRAFSMLCKAESGRVDKVGLIDDIDKAGILKSVEKEEENLSFVNEKFEELVSAYNDSVENDTEKITADSNGLLYDVNGDKVPVEATKDEYIQYHNPEFEVEKTPEVDSDGQSIEYEERPMEEETLDEDDVRYKFLDNVKDGFDKLDIKNSDFEKDINKEITTKATALSSVEEKDVLIGTVAAIREDVDAGKEEIDYKDTEIRGEKLANTQPVIKINEDDDDKKVEITNSSTLSGQADNSNGRGDRIENSVRRHMAGSYARINVGYIPKLSKEQLQEIKDKARDEAKEYVDKLKTENKNVDYKQVFNDKLQENIEKYKDEAIKDMIRENGGDIVKARISDDKMKELKIDASREAKAAVEADSSKNYKEEYEKKLESKTSAVLDELKSLQSDIIKVNTEVEKYDIPGRYMSRHTGYQVNCNTLDALVYKYEKAGGAIGKGEFIEKGVNMFERFLGGIDVLNSNIFETLIFDIFAKGAIDLSDEERKVYSVDTENSTLDIVNTLATPFLTIEKTIAFIPHKISEIAKDIVSDKVDVKLNAINEELKEIDNAIKNDEVELSDMVEDKLSEENIEEKVLETGIDRDNEVLNEGIEEKPKNAEHDTDSQKKEDNKEIISTDDKKEKEIFATSDDKNMPKDDSAADTDKESVVQNEKQNKENHEDAIETQKNNPDEEKAVDDVAKKIIKEEKDNSTDQILASAVEKNETKKDTLETEGAELSADTNSDDSIEKMIEVADEGNNKQIDSEDDDKSSVEELEDGQNNIDNENQDGIIEEELFNDNTQDEYADSFSGNIFSEVSEEGQIDVVNVSSEDKQDIVGIESVLQEDGENSENDVENFINDLAEVLKGNESFMDMINDYMDVFSDERITDEDIPEAFLKAVELSGVTDIESLADTAVSVAETGDGPQDSILDKMFDALSDFVSNAVAFVDELWGKAADAMENVEYIQNESGSDGFVEYSQTEHGLEAINTEFLPDNSTITGMEIKQVTSNLTQDLETGFQNLDNAVDILQQGVATMDVDDSITETAVETAKNNLMENADLIGQTPDKIAQQQDIFQLLNDTQMEQNVSLDKLKTDPFEQQSSIIGSDDIDITD